MRLIVDCPPLPESIWVDRDMWEKVVLNLVSNAYKFTFVGAITVRLKWLGERVELSVEDTGVGIPHAELPRLFDRFYRVAGVQGRSFEGSGIGLALVQELALLHGGTARVESTLGNGSTFTVSIPTGQRQMTAGPVAARDGHVSTATTADAFVNEAQQWMHARPAGDADARENGGPPVPMPGPSHGAAPREHVLLADDNADMRAYIRRLLEGRFSVETVIADNSSSAGAGGLLVTGTDLTVTDTTFASNESFKLNSNLTISVVTGYGGAIRAVDSKLTVIGGSFIDNTGVWGSAISSMQSANATTIVTVQGTNFTNNKSPGQTITKPIEFRFASTLTVYEVNALGLFTVRCAASGCM